MSKIEELIERLCPNGVEYKTIGEVATYRRGSFPQPYTNSSFYGGDGAMPFVQVADIEDNGFKLKEKTKQTISKIAQPKSIYVPKGTVICSIQGTIGRVAITQFDSYIDRTIAIFESFKIEINKRFFAYCIELKFGIEKQFARGSTLKTITKEEFTKFRIPVPPLEVQCEIVHILDDFTELSAELSAELKARQKQYEYYRDKLLTFEEAESLDTLHTHTHTHGYFYRQEIKWLKLQEICKSIKDGMHNLPKNTLDKSKYPILSAQNIFNGEINFDAKRYVDEETYIKENKRTNIEKGDVLLTIVATIGRIAVVKEKNKFLLQRSVCVLKPNELVNPYYLKFYLETYKIQNYMITNAHGSAQSGLYLNQVAEIIVPIPSMDIQNKIVTILTDFYKITHDISEGLPAEIEARQKQYEYYRDKLLTFKELKVNE